MAGGWPAISRVGDDAEKPQVEGGTGKSGPHGTAGSHSYRILKSD